MALVGSEGLTTECQADGTLTMNRDPEGLTASDPEPLLGLHLDGVAWERRYPEPATGIGLTGCHGGSIIDGSNVDYGGIGVILDETGAVTDLLWHFDYYLDETVVTLRNGRARTTLNVMEHLTLSGHDLEWDAATSTVSGWFDLLYHLEDGTTGESIGYEPFFPDQLPRYLSFTFVVQEP